MAPRLTSSKADPVPVAPIRDRLARALETGALFILLIVVAMRPLLSETSESVQEPIARITDTGDSATPATTAWFDLAIWLAALAATVSAALRQTRWRWTGVEIGWVILVLAAVVSTTVAGNKRLAANASCDWLTTIVMLAVLANLLRDRLRVGLLLAVITASGLASAAKCTMQIGVEFAETRQWYDQNKTAIWRRQGISLDDPQADLSTVELFERRLDAREATGFFPHSNAQGAWLALAGFAALAVASLTRRFRSRRVVFAILALALFGSILTSGGRGAMVAAAMGIGLYLLLALVRRAIRQHWRAVLVGAWLVVLAAGAATLAIGSARGGLPGDSLRFRWNYWQVTRGIIADHFWTGVGALNFDRAYMAHKPIEYPEEIKHPHNFAMAILSQWGIIGGVGLVLVLAGASIVLARTLGRQRSEDAPEPVSEQSTRVAARRWIVALVAGFVFLRLWTSPGSLHGDAGLAMMVFDLGLYGLVWSVTLAAAAWLARDGTAGDDDRYRLACLCGAVAFLLHNTIDFALFFPGALTPFMALSAVFLARGRGAGSAEPRPLQCIAPVAVSAAGVICLLWAVLVPVTRSSRLLALACESLPDAAERHYLTAAAADSIDPAPLVKLAQHRAQWDDLDSLTMALGAVDGAIRRDPARIRLHRMRSQLLLKRFDISGAEADLREAIAAAETVLELYPNSPQHHVALAELLARAASAFDSTECATRARQHYLRALDLDSARPVSEVRRWSAARRQWVQQQLNMLQSPAVNRPAATTTAAGK